jgi:RNA recognition motif-containing protein
MAYVKMSPPHQTDEGLYEAQRSLEDAEFSPANYAVGEQHYKNSFLKDNGNEYRLRDPIEKFGQHGVGLQLYFELLRALCITFFVIACVSILPVYDNYHGGWLWYGDIHYFFDLLTLANQDGFSLIKDYLSPSDYWTPLAVVEDTLDDTNQQRRRVVYADLAYTLIFFLGLAIYRFHSAKVIAINNEKYVTTADYAVEVHNHPEDVQETAVIEHFKQFGHVCEAFLSRKHMHILAFYRQRNELSRELRRLQFMKSDPKQIAKAEKKLKECEDKIREKQKHSKKTFNELPVERGFVVFNTIEDRDKCIQAYRNDWWCFKSFNDMPANLKLDGTQPLRVNVAKEPSTIQWENLDRSVWVKLGLRLIARVLTAALLVVSIIFLLQLQIEDNLPNSLECEENKIDPDWSLNEVNENCTEESYRFVFDEDNNLIDQYYGPYNEYDDCDLCWCKGQSFIELTTDSGKSDFCSDYLAKIESIRAMKIFASLVLLFINYMFKIVMTKLTKFERHSNLAMEKVNILIKLFVVSFINTALINLLINVDEFGDFSREWYVKVGATFVLTMAISIGSPHGLYLLFRYPLALFKRRFGWKKHKIQGDLNQMMIGPEFAIEVHTAINLNIVFTCFLYSSGMPIMNWICFFVLLIRYWVDKWLVLRFFKKPPIYKEEINNKALNILPFAGMLHCLFGMYMYGSDKIFPSSYNADNRYVEANKVSLGERMEIESGIIFLVLFAVGFAIWLLDALLHRQILLILTNVFKMNIVTSAKYKSFTENFEDIEKRGIAMYNIWKNPDYARLVMSMNDLAAEIKGPSGGSSNTPMTALLIERIRPMLYRTERVDSSHRLDSSSHEVPRSQEEIRMEPGASKEGRSHSEVSSDQPAPYEAERVNDPRSSHQLSSSSQSHSGNASHIEESPRNEEESRGEQSSSEEERSYREDSSDQPAPYSVPYDPRTELDDGPEASMIES